MTLHRADRQQVTAIKKTTAFRDLIVLHIVGIRKLFLYFQCLEKWQNKRDVCFCGGGCGCGVVSGEELIFFLHYFSI